MRRNEFLVAVCDDETGAAAQAAACCRAVLAKHSMPSRVDSFANADALLAAGPAYAMVFLDISMPDMDGFAAAAALKKQHPHTKIVFLTSHVELVRRAFHYNAFRYLPKPPDHAEMAEAIAAALADAAAARLEIHSQDGRTHYTAINEVLYVESLGDAAAVHLPVGAVVQALPLKHWEAQHGEWLVRTHKSYLVNMAHIKALEEGRALLTGGQAVPVSVRRRAAVKQRLREYVRSHAACMGGAV